MNKEIIKFNDSNLKGYCIRCQEKIARKKNKYCRECGKIVLKELRASGWLPDPKREKFSIHEEWDRKTLFSTIALLHKPNEYSFIEDSFNEDSSP